MTEESRTVIRATKVAAIIKSLSDLYGLPLKDATDLYYRSITSDMIEEGIADLHCRSEKYLASLIWEEFSEHKK